MSAPTSNTNAEKWTIETTEQKLKIIEEYSYEERILYLGQALERADVYEEIWSYWRRKWKDNEDIMHRMKLVDQRFKNKLVAGALSGRLHAGVAKLLLKANYGLSEERKTEESKQESKPASKDRVYKPNQTFEEFLTERYPHIPFGDPLAGRATLSRPPDDGLPYMQLSENSFIPI